MMLNIASAGHFRLLMIYSPLDA